MEEVPFAGWQPVISKYAINNNKCLTWQIPVFMFTSIIVYRGLKVFLLNDWIVYCGFHWRDRPTRQRIMGIHLLSWILAPWSSLVFAMTGGAHARLVDHCQHGDK
jgi:hypothetical protein